MERRVDPRSGEDFWIGGDPVADAMAEGTDGWWCSKGFATLTPIGLDCSDPPEMDRLQRVFGSA